MPYLSCHRRQAPARYSRNTVYLENGFNTDELDQVKKTLHPKTLNPHPYFRYPFDYPPEVQMGIAAAAAPAAASNARDSTPACYPPLLVLTLAGVTKAPIFPKGGAGLNKSKFEKRRSTVVVTYDAFFRLISFSPPSSQVPEEDESGPRFDQTDLLSAMMAAGLMGQFQTAPFARSREEACELAFTGRRPVAEGQQIEKKKARRRQQVQQGGAAPAP